MCFYVFVGTALEWAMGLLTLQGLVARFNVATRPGRKRVPSKRLRARRPSAWLAFAGGTRVNRGVILVAFGGLIHRLGKKRPLTNIGFFRLIARFPNTLSQASGALS